MFGTTLMLPLPLGDHGRDIARVGYSLSQRSPEMITKLARAFAELT